MKKSFRLKVVAVFLAGIIISMFTLTFLSSILLRPLFISNSKKIMEECGVKIEECLKNNPEEIVTLLEEINISYGITTHIVGERGNVIHSYTKLKINRTLASKYEKWIKFYDEKQPDENYYFRQRTDDSDMVKKIVFVGKVSDDMYTIMNKSVKGIEQDIRIVSYFIMIMGFTVSVIGTAVWSVFTKSFTDNIKKMSIITHKMSELNFDEKINHNSDDEIGVLACSIDSLSEKLKASIEGLKEDIERQKRLVRDISHELKTPVTTVKGYIENIQALSSSDKTLEGYCEIASEECDAIDNLVEEMLEMSRLESQGYICDKEKVSLSSIKRNIEDKLSAEFRDVRFSLEFEDVEILCNSVLITRAIMNFVKNAVKYGDSKALIEISGKTEKGYCVFSVANEGKPISDEEKENIWDLFYKKDKARQRNKSHGIGLAIVRQIAVLHKGKVNLECIDGKNIFSFSVPI